MASSYPVSLLHAATFLTAPLNAVSPPAAVQKMHSALKVILYQLACSSSSQRIYVPFVKDHRPNEVVSACSAAGIAWDKWLKRLCGNKSAFELIVTPESVLVTVGKTVHTLWSSDTISVTDYETAIPFIPDESLTFAQQMIMMMDEEESDDVCRLVDVSRMDTPVYRRCVSPSALSTDSSCSSRSSSYGSDLSSTSSGMSRRERARAQRAYVDTSRTEVTCYDEGKTTVLTGGVMLGGGVPSRKHSRQSSLSYPLPISFRA
jgi:hypothetical protein